MKEPLGQRLDDKIAQLAEKYLDDHVMSECLMDLNKAWAKKEYDRMPEALRTWCSFDGFVELLQDEVESLHSFWHKTT